jgi:hypothetical protein
VDLARAARRPARSRVEETWQTEALEVRAEGAALDLDARDLPEALAVRRRAAEKGRYRAAAREPDDAVLGVGLPEPVGGQLGKAAETFFALL